MSAKETRLLIRAIEQAGGTVTKRNNNHYRIVGPGGVYFAGSTPSDHRARKNLISDLRRIGIDVRGVHG